MNRSEDGGGDGKGYEPFRKPSPAKEAFPRPRAEEGDTAQLTSPERAALQLLKELVLQRYRTLLGNPQPPAGGFPASDLPLPEDPQAWATSILRELNLLFGPARAERGEEEAHRLMVRAFREGTEETLEILQELGGGASPETWERITQAGRALFGKLAPFLEGAEAELPAFLQGGEPRKS